MPGNVVVVTFARNTAQTELNDNNNFGKDFGKDFGKELTDRQRITKNGTKGGTKDTAIQLTERQHVIVNLLEDDGTITIPDLARKIRLSVRTVKRELETLQSLGVLHREGGRKEGRWVVDMKV